MVDHRHFSRPRLDVRRDGCDDFKLSATLERPDQTDVWEIEQNYDEMLWLYESLGQLLGMQPISKSVRREAQIIDPPKLDHRPLRLTYQPDAIKS